MDLNRAARVKGHYDAAPPEDKAVIDEQVRVVLEALERELPALPETDRAAAAWLLAEVVATLLQTPAEELPDILFNSAIAYAVASVKLLGWDS